MLVSASSSHLPFNGLPMRLRGPLRATVCCGLLGLGALPLAARAATGDNLPIDSQMIATLQLRAQQASPKEQVQLYADLADKISVLASRQLADGEIEKAQLTLHQLEATTAQIEVGLKNDSKGLKKTELLLHTTDRRLKDMVRSASGDMKPMVQTALKQLDKVQTALLGIIFEK